MLTAVISVFAADTIWSGTGTRSNPYLITNVADLKALAQQVNNGTSYRSTFFRQTADIDLSAVRGVVGWVPIGTYGRKGFDGSYDGGNHTISGLYINNSLDGQALFGFVDDSGVVSNVILTNCDISANNHVAAVAGYLAGTVSGCAVRDGKISVAGTFCNGGGIAGSLHEGTISSCMVSGCTIESNYSQTGGIVGAVLNGTVNDCSVDGTSITGGSHMGAIIGASEGGAPTLRNNHYTKSVKGIQGGVDGKDVGANGAVLGDVVTNIIAAPAVAATSAAVTATTTPTVPATPTTTPQATTVTTAVTASATTVTTDKTPSVAAAPAATAAAASVSKAVALPKTGEGYIVKTSGVTKEEKSTAVAPSAGGSAQQQEATDFMGKNFRYISMCDWTPGMRFMVMPEKYDMLVNTFCDATTNAEVSSSSLRHKIMVFKGHEDTPEGRVHVNFTCEETGKNYYYELPSGTFENYCFGKMGVPTLAYLGDVDKARELLIEKTLLTRTQFYRVDTEYDGDGFKEVVVDKNRPVTVKAVGVGTRSYPVKIIVEDENGVQFYQNVAMSKTNSGMRDDEFSVDNEKFLFEGSFEYPEGDMIVSDNVRDYLNSTVHTKYATAMSSKGSGKVRDVKVPKFTGFIIDDIQPIKNTRYFTLTLRESETRRLYYKDVVFKMENVGGSGTDSIAKEDYFGYVFAMGEGVARNTSLETRTAIREGRVIPNMTQEEVEMAMGEAQKKERRNGVEYWLYDRTNSILVVEFNEDNIVKQAKARALNENESKNKKKAAKRKNGRSKQTIAGGNMTTGTPL
jgi:hypothetical protein